MNNFNREKMDNQFIVDYIILKGGSVKEYHLLKYIEEEHPLFFGHLSNPCLYKKHFYLFNQLYNLRDVLIDQSRTLLISSLEIKLISNNKKQNKEIGRTEVLRSFYLDLNNLYLSDEEVSDMLNAFWDKYYAIDKKIEAIKVLGLEGVVEVDLLKIKSAYTKLAHQYHPDKGGCSNTFLKVQKAYSLLKRCY